MYRTSSRTNSYLSVSLTLPSLFPPGGAAEQKKEGKCQGHLQLYIRYTFVFSAKAFVVQQMPKNLQKPFLRMMCWDAKVQTQRDVIWEEIAHPQKRLSHYFFARKDLPHFRLMEKGGGEKPIHFSPEEEEEEEEAGPEYKARGLRRRRRMWQIFFSPPPQSGLFPSFFSHIFAREKKNSGSDTRAEKCRQFPFSQF